MLQKHGCIKVDLFNIPGYNHEYNHEYRKKKKKSGGRVSLFISNKLSVYQ